MPTTKDIQFGRLAVKHNVVPEDKVRECLAELKAAGGTASLSKLLLGRGLISEKQVQAIEGRLRQDASVAAARSSKRSARPPAEARAASGQPMSTKELAARDYSALAGKPVDEYLKEARRVGASDLHFQVESPPFLRLHGSIVYMKHPVLKPEDTEPRVLATLRGYEREKYAARGEVDFCYEADHGRYRASVSRQRKGIDGVYRVIPQKVPTIEELNLPTSVKRFTAYRHGIVLITGPAGCGKTSTMAALLDLINEAQHDHIVTVEEPIEYVLASKNCNVNQRHVRVHTASFASALRSAMRSDPDYICVGEMRDLETVSMAITAAETGHLVFGTLHTPNATRSVDRLVDVFPPKEQEQIRAMVSSSLRGVISQQLLPRADGRGRVPAVELLFATTAVSNLIREHKTFQLPSVIQTGVRQGMIAMDDSITELLKKQLITRETAQFHSEHPDRFKAGGGTHV